MQQKFARIEESFGSEESFVNPCDFLYLYRRTK